MLLLVVYRFKTSMPLFDGATITTLVNTFGVASIATLDSSFETIISYHYFFVSLLYEMLGHN
jgi:hypothetical protein